MKYFIAPYLLVAAINCYKFPESKRTDLSVTISRDTIPLTEDKKGEN